MLDLGKLVSESHELLVCKPVGFGSSKPTSLLVVVALLHVLLKELHFPECHQFVFLGTNNEDRNMIREL